jgi:hypothetical protein
MISRRDLIVAAGAALALPRRAESKLACQDLGAFRRCSVGVIVSVPTALQECPNWCWAACVEAIFTFHNHKVNQRRIVRKVFGSEACLPAHGPQIVNAVDGEWTDDRSGRDPFDARAEVLWDAEYGFRRPDAILEAARELEADNPLIIGALGHATVLTSMTYTGNQFGVQINEMVVRDPMPGRPNRRVLTPQEALSTQFLAKVEVY